MEYVSISFTTFGWEAYFMRPQSQVPWGKCWQLGHGPNGNGLRDVVKFAKYWTAKMGIDCPIWIDRKSHLLATRYRAYCEAHTETETY